MYMKEFKYNGFKLFAFRDNVAINIIEFDQDPEFIEEPLEGKNNQMVEPGQNIAGLICNKTSAGFGSLHLSRGMIKYLGKVKLPEETLVVFEYIKTGIYYGYIQFMKTDMFDPGPLFFLNYAGSGRIIEVDKILFNNIGKGSEK